jgi:5-epimerase
VPRHSPCTWYTPLSAISVLVRSLFVALEDDDTVVSYMLSGSYVASDELALSVLDPALGLPIDTDTEPILSDQDRVAITLAEAQQQGLLPDYARCQEIEWEQLSGAAVTTDA